jgi:hypothetical protein
VTGTKSSVNQVICMMACPESHALPSPWQMCAAAVRADGRKARAYLVIIIIIIIMSFVANHFACKRAPHLMPGASHGTSQGA